MISIKNKYRKCPVCKGSIIFPNTLKQDINENSLVCPHCNTKLRHNRLKLILVFVLPIFPMIIVGYSYPIHIRFIVFVFTVLLISIIWVLLGYEVNSD